MPPLLLESALVWIFLILSWFALLAPSEPYILWFFAPVSVWIGTTSTFYQFLINTFGTVANVLSFCGLGMSCILSDSLVHDEQPIPLLYSLFMGVTCWVPASTSSPPWIQIAPTDNKF